MTDEEILKKVLERAKALPFNDTKELDDIIRKSILALENLFPFKSYNIDIKYIRFSELHYSQVPESTLIKEWNDGKNKLINLLDTAILDLKVSSENAIAQPTKTNEKIVPSVDNPELKEVEAKFANYKRNVKNWCIYSILAVVLSIILWLLFFYSSWKWYNGLDKKLGITLTFNLLIFFSLLNIPLKGKWVTWITIAGTVMVALFALL